MIEKKIPRGQKEDVDNKGSLIKENSSYVLPELIEYINIIDNLMAKWPYYQDQFYSELVQYKDIDRAYEYVNKSIEIYDIILDILQERRKSKKDSGVAWRSAPAMWNAVRILSTQRKGLKKAQKHLDFKQIMTILRRSAKTIGVFRSNLFKIMEFGLDKNLFKNEQEDEQVKIEEKNENIGQKNIVGAQIIEISKNTTDESETKYKEVPFCEILGEWDEEYDMIDHGRVNKPIDLRKHPSLYDDKSAEIAVDVARYGEDRTVLAISQCGHTVDVRSYSKADVMETTGYVVKAIEDYDAKIVKIETTGGLGAGIVDRLKELQIGNRCKIVALEVQGAPTMKGNRLKAFNLRAELYLNLEESLRLGTFTIPPDEEVAQDLAHITYRMLSNGRIMIDDKDSIKKRLGRSPDKGDAIAILAWRASTPKIF